ncbi:MAG: HeH/LEM domain-containing protein [Clostridia bacterium]|nr:HeH/LEM domain-containing protein [Clostridia bacterium]
MKFKNKKNNEIVEAKSYAQEFAYSHNSEWEEMKDTKAPKVEEIKSKLTELGIEYDDKAKKDELLALLPQK